MEEAAERDTERKVAKCYKENEGAEIGEACQDTVLTMG